MTRRIAAAPWPAHQGAACDTADVGNTQASAPSATAAIAHGAMNISAPSDDLQPPRAGPSRRSMGTGRGARHPAAIASRDVVDQKRVQRCVRHPAAELKQAPPEHHGREGPRPAENETAAEGERGARDDPDPAGSRSNPRAIAQHPKPRARDGEERAGGANERQSRRRIAGLGDRVDAKGQRHDRRSEQRHPHRSGSYA